MKKSSFGLFLSLMLVAPVSRSLAQSGPLDKPLQVRIGAHFPTDGDSREYGGDVQLATGLSYTFAAKGDSRVHPSIYFDYHGGSRDSGHVQSFNLGGAVRSYFSGDMGGSRAYYGAGLAISHNRVKSGIESPGDGGDGEGGDGEGDGGDGGGDGVPPPVVHPSKNKTGISGKVFAGVEFSRSFFLEAAYTFQPKVLDINPSGFELTLGGRF